MNNIEFDFLQIWHKETDMDDERPFLLACRDRELVHDERWVLASFTEEEAKKIYEYFGNFFGEQEK